MPDLITHTAFTVLTRNRNWKPEKLLLYIFGAMLPDLLTRPFMIMFQDYIYFFHTFHTPFALCLILILLSLYFEPNFRFTAFKLIGLGILTHLVLDVFQATVSERSYSWLFPFSYTDYQLGLFWPEDSLLVLHYTILLVLIDFIVTKYLFGKNGKKTEASK